MSEQAHLIREYLPGDKEDCLSIFDSNVPDYFVDNERQEYLEWLDKTDRAPYYVLLQDSEIVAAGGVYIDKEMNIAGLAWGMVHGAKHKQGLGRLLTIHRLEVMDQLYPDLDQHLETSQHTEAFYQKFGFVTTERIKDGFGPGLDNCKMRKKRVSV